MLVVSSLRNPKSAWESFDIETVPSDFDLSCVQISAADVGCEPGTEILVELYDDAGDLLSSVIETAQ